MPTTTAAPRDDVELTAVPVVTFTGVESTARAAAAVTRTHGTARIVGLPLEHAVALGDRLGELLGGPASPWAAPPGSSRYVDVAGVGCQDLTPPAEKATHRVSPWSVPLSGG